MESMASTLQESDSPTLSNVSIPEHSTQDKTPHYSPSVSGTLQISDVEDIDRTAVEKPTEKSHEHVWSYKRWLNDYEERSSAGNIKKKHLALTWDRLKITGSNSKAVLGDDVLSYINPLEYIRSAGGKSTLEILHEVTGQVLPGEMLLVLGRPGSGCTSFLKAVANKRASFKEVSGDVWYGSMSHEGADKYRGAVLYNNEDDIHSPTLTVKQTLATVAHSRVARHHRSTGKKTDFVVETLDVVPRALGISHTAETLVGNEFIRGVSGGERKRVSLGEILAAKASIMCWDNATRGLDASSALAFNENLRHLADESNATILTTLYQAGNRIYDLYDNVMVLDEGYQIYYGPRWAAQGYFEAMGFICPAGANIADFLTSVTVPTERQVRDGFHGTVPTSAKEFQEAYSKSDVADMMSKKIIPATEFHEETKEMHAAYREEQPKHRSPMQGSYKIGLFDQTITCVIRQTQILLGDPYSMIMQQLSSLIFALISGSLYYNLPDTSAGLFTRSGALFFPIVVFNIVGMAEVTASFMGRPILVRHRDFSLYRPTAFVIARMITDIPSIVAQATTFSIVYYFMCGFQADAGKFFTFWIMSIILALVLTQMYRFIGSAFTAFDNAAKVSGFWVVILMLYAGYFIPYQNMHVWFFWLSWLSPAFYAYESYMGNEFGGLLLACTGQQLIPNGASYNNTSNQVCAVAGVSNDGLHVVGSDYITQSYSFKVDHVWRNFGIMVGWWFFYAVATAIALERPHHNSGSSSLIFARGKKSKHTLRKPADEENPSQVAAAQSTMPQSNELSLARNEALFTWENLSYTVSVPGGHRKLLNEITGWVKPGTLGALMGSSGAGKTTLLDVLAQRKDAGVVEGSILVDGRPLPFSFQRSAGYCEQMDVHESTATVREALVLSARLRQPRDVPDEDKITYVNSIITLLEMEDIEDALIGEPGAGLSIEQRKRVTIGVELAAKPSILLFLDEPTSGLDGQSAFNVVRFLRRLTAAGQAVLCTIHQPSATLFEAFDTLLLLAKGGNTVYFGDTGSNSETLLNYFAINGAPCPTNANPAEHIINVVSEKADSGDIWTATWLQSPERAECLTELAALKADALSRESTVKDSQGDFATPLMTQLRLITSRQQAALWRNPDYVWNKIFLHVSSGLMTGFSFWKLGNKVSDLQLRLLSVFGFLFVAVGVINQLQPLFIHNRNIFEAREKKAKMYSWLAFVASQLIAEIPYLIVCGTMYFCTWYFTVGLPIKGSTSGQVFFTMILYEFLYTAIGQGIAAVSPNSYFASLLNPIILGSLFINFCGVLVPYNQIVVFWKYWMYYIDPFTYLVGGLLTQILFDVDVKCAESELASFVSPANMDCGDYMAKFFETGAGYLVNNSTSSCSYCPYKYGSQYAKTMNLNARYYGWRDTGIVALFCFSSYGFVFLMMRIRSKKTKSAKSE